MDGIRIEVTGNIARVTQKPAKITTGTVGLPIEFSFDSHWEGLSKTVVFRAGLNRVIKQIPGSEMTVPWELLEHPGAWLSVGVYGENKDGTKVIPTIWANVGSIYRGVEVEGDEAAEAPSPTVWSQLSNQIQDLEEKTDGIEAAISEWTGTYELDLRECVKMQPDGESGVEQRYDVTDNVDAEALLEAVNAGRSVRVRCILDMGFLGWKQECAVLMTEESGSAGDGSGKRVLSSIGLDMLYATDDMFDYHYFRLYVGTDADGKAYASFSFTPSSLNQTLNRMVRSVNGQKPDLSGNVEISVGEGSVKSVNGNEPDESGNVVVETASVDEVLAAIPTVSSVAVTENADGSVTMVNTLSDGSTETIVVTADAEGNPNGLTVNGTAIPLSWTEVTA